ncbi:CAP domain-containing protein [Streptomyces sp. URMC 127]|uniref:CAP domain-containing protein n=1 Tax=Streptomyces sp. URMC 127 TaxID=3423402 RepID=UPI003F19F8D9
MHRRTACTAALVMVATFLTSAGSCDPGAPGSSQSVLDAVNEKRVAVGCPKVKGDEKLRAAAERYAVDLRDHPAVRGKPWPHPGSDGSTAPSRIQDAGFAPSAAVGEIAYYDLAEKNQQQYVSDNINWWWNSPPHKATISNCSFTRAGVGLLYPGGKKWFSVVSFGRLQTD